MMRQDQLAPRIPLNIQRIAARSRLGTPQVIYTSRNAPSLSRFMGFFGMIIGALIILFFFLTYDALFRWWPLWQAALIPSLGAGWLCVGVWITLTSVLPQRPRVILYSDGLFLVKGKTSIIRWDQIEAVWKGTTMAGLSRSYLVRQVDGTTHVFTNELSNVEELGAILEDEVTARYLPRALAMYYAGIPVYFGDILLNLQGMSMQEGRTFLLWSEVENVSINETTISLYKRGEFWSRATALVSDIPNVGVLKRLVDHILRERMRGQLPWMIATYDAGIPVIFGSLSISLQGVDVNNGKNSIPWSEIASIGVGESEVIIGRKGMSWDWHALPLSKISDALLLKELLDYITRNRP